MTGARKAAVIIGASAGALDALSLILPRLAPGFPLPVIVVVHVPPDKRSVLAAIFDAKCRLRAVEAEDKEPLTPGVIYFAPPDYHLLIEQGDTVALSNEDQVLFSRPSIDVAFESAADVWGEAVIGIVLTGANQDGAMGLKAIATAGGTAIVQDPREAYAAAMPEAAIAACPEALVLNADGIVSHLQSVTR